MDHDSPGSAAIPSVPARHIDWRKVRRILFILLLLLLALLLGAFAHVTRQRAHELITQPLGQHKLPSKTPADFGLPFRNVTIASSDGLKLVGWYVPSSNGALIIAQHGYKASRGEMLRAAQMLHRHGYGILITSVRAHDGSDGERISFGHEETKDLDAWYRYALTLPGINPQRIGMLGSSMGGSLVIQYAAGNPAIRAVAANSAFSSLDSVVGTAVHYFTGLPSFPFAPAIVFWAEQEGGFKASEINTRLWVHRLSPRPILLMQGGADIVIPADSGQRLFEAAGEPKELWFEPSLGHTEFDKKMPEEYERRVTGFFDRYLQAPAH